MLAAIASALAHSQVSDTKIDVAIISVAVAALTALQTFLNPSEREQKHLVAGNNYASLENRTTNLLGRFNVGRSQTPIVL